MSLTSHGCSSETKPEHTMQFQSHLTILSLFDLIIYIVNTFLKCASNNKEEILYISNTSFEQGHSVNKYLSFEELKIQTREEQRNI